MTRAGHLHIGTSGWSYSGWKKTFYPPGVKPSAWLGYYSTQFGTVEVNSTFYRLPTPGTVAGWARKVPMDFRFCFKMWRAVTHLHKLHDADDSLSRGLAALAPGRDHSGPLLFQLPPSLKRDDARLESFLHLLARRAKGWKLAMEFRHASWHAPEVYALLDRHGVALVRHDMPGSAVTEPNAGCRFVYIRYHGPTGDYGGSYDRAHLEREAAAIHGWLAEGRDVYAFFNNDRDGYAVQNADTLRQCIEGTGDAPLPDPLGALGTAASLRP